MIEHFYTTLSEKELEEYRRQQEIYRKKIEDEEKERLEGQKTRNAEKDAYEAEQDRLAQEKKDKEVAKMMKPIEEAQQRAQQRDELSKKSAEAMKITIMSIVFGVVGFIILTMLWYFRKNILKYLGIIQEKQEIQGQQGQETIVKADMVIASNGHVTQLNTPSSTQKVMQLKKTTSFNV